MSIVNAWIGAARLRTLPLSIAGIITGSAYSYLYSGGTAFKWWSVLLALAATLCFQILSNFANDYGDGVKGTDNNDRIGPKRALQSGMLTETALKRAMFLMSILAILFSIWLIYYSLGAKAIYAAVIFMVLGALAVWAAISYTVGDSAYGYQGLGDIFVFIFFGPVSVLGMAYLLLLRIPLFMVFPSITVGLLSVAVLNLNNMRDVISDKKSGKLTLAVKWGLTKAKSYHHFIVIIAMISATIYAAVISLEAVDLAKWTSVIMLLPLIIFFPLTRHLKYVRTTLEPGDLDPELKKVALSTFGYSILSAIAAFVVIAG